MKYKCAVLMQTHASILERIIACLGLIRLLTLPDYLANNTKESKKLSALLFFQFIYTKVGVEQVRHFSI
jgi:hypothetical protein